MKDRQYIISDVLIKFIQIVREHIETTDDKELKKKLIKELKIGYYDTGEYCIEDRIINEELIIKPTDKRPFKYRVDDIIDKLQFKYPIPVTCNGSPSFLPDEEKEHWLHKDNYVLIKKGNYIKIKDIKDKKDFILFEGEFETFEEFFEWWKNNIKKYEKQ